jgi:hypothetical protein
MTSIKWILVTLILGSVFLGIIAVNAQETTSNSNTITIDDMKSVDMWLINSYDNNNASIDISPDVSGLNISYNLKEEGSWVDIEREIDFSTIPELSKIKFYFAGSGAPNTLEFLLVYEDGSIFKYKHNKATNTSDYISLTPNQITYSEGGKLKRPLTEQVDFSKVKAMDFAISNYPNADDKPGKGFVIIGGVVGEKTPPLPPSPTWYEKYNNLLVAAITGFFGIVGGYIAGRR